MLSSTHLGLGWEGSGQAGPMPAQVCFATGMWEVSLNPRRRTLPSGRISMMVTDPLAIPIRRHCPGSVPRARQTNQRMTAVADEQFVTGRAGCRGGVIVPGPLQLRVGVGVLRLGGDARCSRGAFIEQSVPPARQAESGGDDLTRFPGPRELTARDGREHDGKPGEAIGRQCGLFTAQRQERVAGPVVRVLVVARPMADEIEGAGGRSTLCGRRRCEQRKRQTGEQEMEGLHAGASFTGANCNQVRRQVPSARPPAS